MRLYRFGVVVLIGCSLTVGIAVSQNAAPYQNAQLPVEQRIADLLARMTLDEKIAQLQEIPTKPLVIENGRVTQTSMEEQFKGLSYGTLQAMFGSDLRTQAIVNRDAQEYAKTRTRLGIPMLPMHETIHGILGVGATIYPQVIAQGATWNPELIETMAAAIAEEAVSVGIVQSLAPMLTLARDARWGRVEECFGECPYLVSRMGVAYIRGIQGADARHGLQPDKLAAMLKVMAGYEASNGGLNIAPASIGEREMRSLYLVPFEAAVKDGYAYSVMPSYNAVDGMPAHANHWLLTRVLRDEWGFFGYTYSDWGGVEMNGRRHRVADDKPESALLAIKAGVDLEAPQADCYQYLAQLVRDGRLEERVIDLAATRVLRVKFLSGVFDGKRRPVEVNKLNQTLHKPEYVTLARRIAEESVILLKNDDRLLPLDVKKLRTIGLIGPNADQVQFGDYSPTKSNDMGVTVREGLEAALAGSGIALRYAQGCAITGQNREGFEQAVAIARNSDVVICVVGGTSMIIGGGIGGVIGTESEEKALATVGEGYDRTDLTLPGVQEELIRTVHAVGKPMIVVLVHGRPNTIPWIKQHIPAVLDAWYPGEQGGAAIADILLGVVNPSGRLPVSVPQSAGHIPTVYDYHPIGRGYYLKPGTPDKPGRDYVFSTPDPLWPFGYGLNYTTFQYSGLEILTPAVRTTDEIKIHCNVRNTGLVAGKETVQMYVRDDVSSVTTPEKRLIRFLKENLAPGETRQLEFVIRAEELALWDVQMHRVVEPGKFTLMVGASSEDITLTGSFEVVQ